MAKSEIIMGELGGGTQSIIPDTTQVLGTITTNTGTYTATEDCIMCGSIGSNNSSVTAWVNIDTVSNHVISGVPYNSTTGIYFYGIYIPKGTTVSVRQVNVTYDITFYKIA